MNDHIIAIPPRQVPGRPFQRGRSGNPVGRRPGSRNKATLASAKLLAGEAEGLTRKAVEAAFAGDPMALRLCVERLLPVCRERPVKFKLPPIESPADIATCMKAVTSALAKGEITPGEAGRIAGVVDTFVPRDRDERVRAAPAGTRTQGGGRRRCRGQESRIDLALQPTGVILLLICCK
jgi:hypothetical protein